MATCKYCGVETECVNKIAKFPCCSERSKDCSGYRNWLSVNRKKIYKERPELIETMRRIRFEISKRPEVIESKKQAMINLHRGNDEKSLKFQENYRLGRERCSQKIYDRQYKFLKSIGVKDENIPTDREEFRKFVSEAHVFYNNHKKRKERINGEEK